MTLVSTDPFSDDSLQDIAGLEFLIKSVPELKNLMLQFKDINFGKRIWINDEERLQEFRKFVATSHLGVSVRCIGSGEMTASFVFNEYPNLVLKILNDSIDEYNVNWEHIAHIGYQYPKTLNSDLIVNVHYWGGTFVITDYLAVEDLKGLNERDLDIYMNKLSILYKELYQNGFYIKDFNYSNLLRHRGSLDPVVVDLDGLALFDWEEWSALDDSLRIEDYLLFLHYTSDNLGKYKSLFNYLIEGE